MWLAALAALCPPSLKGQGPSVSGRVVADSTNAALVDAEVMMTPPVMTQRTDATGAFRFANLPAGEYILRIRMPGYAPVTDTIVLADAGDVQREYHLQRIEVVLPEVPVTATLLDRKLYDFHERRRIGIGRFLDSAEFANSRGMRTSDRLRKLPGVVILRGRFSDGYVANNRQRTRTGAWCRAAVWVDGVNLGNDYNVNELDPSVIAAVEWYAGQASIPAQFNIPPRPGQTYCGVLVIWLR